MTWKYLLSKPFRIRHQIAAQYLKEYSYIIELGGFTVPISNSLEHNYKQIVSVDPLTPFDQKEKILHLNEDYRFIDFSNWIKGPYALVMLGMDLPFDPSLVQLCLNADRIVIEFPPEHRPSVALFETLKTLLDHTIELQVGIDLSGNDFGDLTDSFPLFPHRKFYVLQKFVASQSLMI